MLQRIMPEVGEFSESAFFTQNVVYFLDRVLVHYPDFAGEWAAGGVLAMMNAWYSNEETAETLGMSMDNYYNKHKLAKEQFAKILRKEGLI